MKRIKVVKIDGDIIVFDNGVKLFSEHDYDCCESHELDMSDLIMDDFKGMFFDLTNDDFFKKIEGYGIELIPIKGHSVKIPGYGYNNGYYSDNLDLVITDGKDFKKVYDITECQEDNY